MPNQQDIKSVLTTKPLNFTIKTGNGKWKCTLHSDRAAYERTRTDSITEGVVPTPGITRTDSDMSVSSTGSSFSH